MFIFSYNNFILFSEGAAEKAGVQIGDRIIKVSTAVVGDQ